MQTSAKMLISNIIKLNQINYKLIQSPEIDWPNDLYILISSTTLTKSKC